MSVMLVKYFRPVAIVFTIVLIVVMDFWWKIRTPHMCVVNVDSVEQRTTLIVVVVMNVFQPMEKSLLKMENQ